jgi:hypothetical protein
MRAAGLLFWSQYNTAETKMQHLFHFLRNNFGKRRPEFPAGAPGNEFFPGKNRKKQLSS